MKPTCSLNLNGMVKGGTKPGRRYRSRRGEMDQELLKLFARVDTPGLSDSRPHSDDAAERLADNLDGLAWLKRA